MVVYQTGCALALFTYPYTQEDADEERKTL